MKIFNVDDEKRLAHIYGRRMGQEIQGDLLDPELFRGYIFRYVIFYFIFFIFFLVTLDFFYLFSYLFLFIFYLVVFLVVMINKVFQWHKVF